MGENARAAQASAARRKIRLDTLYRCSFTFPQLHSPEAGTRAMRHILCLLRASTSRQGTFEEWDADAMPTRSRLRELSGEDLVDAGAAEASHGTGGDRNCGARSGSWTRAFSPSMGATVGEKIARLFDRACERKAAGRHLLPRRAARCRRGSHRLMQMAKTSLRPARHDAAGLLYVSVLTDPTTGGVTASFAMQGDVILAEPGALIGRQGSASSATPSSKSCRRASKPPSSRSITA